MKGGVEKMVAAWFLVMCFGTSFAHTVPRIAARCEWCATERDGNLEFGLRFVYRFALFLFFFVYFRTASFAVDWFEIEETVGSFLMGMVFTHTPVYRMYKNSGKMAVRSVLEFAPMACEQCARVPPS